MPPPLPDRVVVRARSGYELHLGPQYVTPAVLRELFLLDTVHLLDAETIELFEAPDDDAAPFPVPTGRVYMVVTTEDVRAVLKDEDPPALPESPHEAAALAGQLVAARRRFVASAYRHQHPYLLQFSVETWLEPALAAALTASDGGASLRALCRSPSGAMAPLFVLPAFRRQVCDDLVAEVIAFEASGLPVVRPNSMNNYGVVLDEIGMEGALQALMQQVVSPLAHVLLPRFGGQSLDTHHGFVVQYRMHQDRALNFHYDDSEITLNVCLGREFTGGSLFFRGLLEDSDTHDEQAVVEHTAGHGVLHYGQHRHGATSIASGERFNLILWCRSSQYRAAREAASADAAGAAVGTATSGCGQHKCDCGPHCAADQPAADAQP